MTRRGMTPVKVCKILAVDSHPVKIIFLSPSTIGFPSLLRKSWPGWRRRRSAVNRCMTALNEPRIWAKGNPLTINVSLVIYAAFCRSNCMVFSFFCQKWHSLFTHFFYFVNIKICAFKKIHIISLLYQ